MLAQRRERAFLCQGFVIWCSHFELKGGLACLRLCLISFGIRNEVWYTLYIFRSSKEARGFVEEDEEVKSLGQRPYLYLFQRCLILPSHATPLRTFFLSFRCLCFGTFEHAYYKSSVLSSFIFKESGVSHVTQYGNDYRLGGSFMG